MGFCGARMDNKICLPRLYQHEALGAALQRFHSHVAVSLLLKERKLLWPEIILEIGPTLCPSCLLLWMNLSLSSTLLKADILASWKGTEIQLLEKVAEFVMQLLGELTAKGRGADSQVLRERLDEPEVLAHGYK